MRLPLRVATLAMTASISVAGLSGATVATADAAATGIYKNGTALHARYPHGVGRTTARDRTSGRPVTTVPLGVGGIGAAEPAATSHSRTS